MIMNNSILHRSCRNLLRTATVQQRGHSRIVNVSRGYDKTTLFFNHQNQSPGIVNVHGKGATTNSCSGGNIATVFARGMADVSRERTHEKELVRVQLNGFRDRLADIGSNVENHLGQFSNRISSSEKTNHLLFGAMVGVLGILWAKIDSTSEKLDNKIDSTSKELNNKIDSNSKELNNKIDSNSKELNKISQDLNNKIDALGAKIDQGMSRKSWPW